LAANRTPDRKFEANRSFEEWLLQAAATSCPGVSTVHDERVRGRPVELGRLAGSAFWPRLKRQWTGADVSFLAETSESTFVLGDPLSLAIRTHINSFRGSMMNSNRR